jgi:elongation factor 2
MGKNYEPMDAIPAGGIVMILGVDNAIIKTGTITTCETACNIRSMKYTISPILRVAVNVANQQDLQKLIDGLKML